MTGLGLILVFFFFFLFFFFLGGGGGGFGVWGVHDIIGVAPITQPTHVRNKNSNIQRRSPYVVKVISIL